jgi:hypothetical protein
MVLNLKNLPYQDSFSLFRIATITSPLTSEETLPNHLFRSLDSIRDMFCAARPFSF